MELGILSIFILVTISTSSINIRTGLVTKRANFLNRIITNNILSIAGNARSTVQCLMLCLEMQACVSVFYRQVSRRCQFHDVLFLSPQDGEEENGTKYYSLTTGSCPRGYIHACDLGLCYQVHLNWIFYLESTADCASRNEHLIVIDSQEKQDHLRKQLSSSSGSCPRGYIHARDLGLCYQVHLNWIFYLESTADCASRNEHLIVIDSQEKQDHLRKQLSSSSEAMLEDYFIDGNDVHTEGQWVYHDGRPMTFFAWDEGWPKNITSHWDYMVARRKGGAFLWQDSRKGERHYYLCEKDI